jgi:transposase
MMIRKQYRELQSLLSRAFDPQAWLADVLSRLPDRPAKRIDELLPWIWRPQTVSGS